MEARCWLGNTSQISTIWFCFRAALCSPSPAALGLGGTPSHLVFIKPLEVDEAGCESLWPPLTKCRVRTADSSSLLHQLCESSNVT